MEQPRFGGVALPPLSTAGGEGKSSESITDTMESTKFPKPDIGQASPSSDLSGTDPDVQRVMEVLRQLGISPHLERHKLKHERQRESKTKPVDNEVYCKNLLVKDKKGQTYLIVCGEDDRADLHVVKYHLNAHGNLHFASTESLWSLLRVKPGAVSPLALVHASASIRVLIDDSLVKRIDKDSTKLYFHPLKDDLQVALTFSQLERFLDHCDVSLERLPSLTSYSARRRYNNLKGGCYYKHKPNQEHKDSKLGEAEEEATEKDGTLQQVTQHGEMMAQMENTFTQHSDLLQQLGISMDTVPAKGDGSALDFSSLPCKSVYLKDKRANYFLFICHESQKVDFSSLKKLLKPRKKIEPLDREELWSLLRLCEHREHPFALAQLKQPQFLVAISANLNHKGSVVLTFPHPADPGLRLQITMKQLETFMSAVGHQVITIQMKGNIEELQAMSSSSPTASTGTSIPQPFHAHSNDVSPHEPVDERNGQLSRDQDIVHIGTTAGQHRNLFYHLTTPLREWTSRFITHFVRLLNQYLPNQILAGLRQSLFWNRILTPGNYSTAEQKDHVEEQANGTQRREEHKMAKIAKLQQLIKQSGAKVDLTDIQPQARFLKDDSEQCKTYLLADGVGQLYIVLCTEEDDPSKRNVRRLRTAFRSRSALHLVNDAGLSHCLPWPEDSPVSWTQEDFNPVALMDMVLHNLGQVKVGMTGALYSFPDTMLRFDLPSLGVTLQLSNDDLEKMITQAGFRVVYLS